MEKNKSIEAIQFFATHLAEGAMAIFKSQGFTNLDVNKA